MATGDGCALRQFAGAYQQAVCAGVSARRGWGVSADEFGCGEGVKMEKGANLSKDKKDATLTLHLKADSGYSSYVEYRVNPNQWARILKILEEKNNG